MKHGASTEMAGQLNIFYGQCFFKRGKKRGVVFKRGTKSEGISYETKIALITDSFWMLLTPQKLKRKPGRAPAAATRQFHTNCLRKMKLRGPSKRSVTAQRCAGRERLDYIFMWKRYHCLHPTCVYKWTWGLQMRWWDCFWGPSLLRGQDRPGAGWQHSDAVTKYLGPHVWTELTSSAGENKLFCSSAEVMLQPTSWSQSFKLVRGSQ